MVDTGQLNIAFLGIEISVAAPAFNEAAGLGDTVRHWAEWLRTNEKVRRFEIVVCNDGSTDETGAVLSSLADQVPELVAVEHPVNRGAAAAMATSIRHTSMPWVLLLDSDGQFPIENLDQMLAALDLRARMAIVGSRKRKADTAFARFGSWASSRLCNLAHGTNFSDFTCMMRLLPGELVRSLPINSRGLNLPIELTSRLLERGVDIREVEIDHRARETGTGSLVGTKALFAAKDRVFYVGYVGARQLLLRLGVIRVDQDNAG